MTLEKIFDLAWRGKDVRLIIQELITRSGQPYYEETIFCQMRQDKSDSTKCGACESALGCFKYAIILQLMVILGSAQISLQEAEHIFVHILQTNNKGELDQVFQQLADRMLNGFEGN